MPTTLLQRISPAIAAYWEKPNPVINAYVTLRFVIGVLGIALPGVVAFWGFFVPGGEQLLPSISDYYCLRTRDALVGILFAIAWFLFTYRGYTRGDDIASNLACLFALGVALFPLCGEYANPLVHYVCAVGFFLVLAYFSFFLFTKSGDNPTPQKKQRNKVYRACGTVMFLCILLIVVYHLTGAHEPIKQFKPVFWLETIATLAFGLSWFVKGETIIRDTAP
jgi:hypothetical protein